MLFMTRYCKFREKEVINCIDGRILGYVTDLVIDECDGRITAIVVPPPGRWFLCFGRPERDIVIPWKKIQKIGKDVIIVCVDCNCNPGCD